MQTHFDDGVLSDDGFIYIASRDRLYYEFALLSCESLRDYHPNAHVTLYTHKKFIDDRCQIFNRVIFDIPIHLRAKMWCMARTPYKRTLYNDVDTIIGHKDIRKMHDLMNDCDMFFGSHLRYTVANKKWAYIDKALKIPVMLHGSMCGYHNTELNIDFMQTWFDEYIIQRQNKWPYGFAHSEWQQFDMFTLWRLTCKRFDQFKRFNDLNIKILPRHWNTTIQDLPEDIVGPRIITQIDKNSYRRMPAVWDKIKKRIENERYASEKSKTNSNVDEFN